MLKDAACARTHGLTLCSASRELVARILVRIAPAPFVAWNLPAMCECIGCSKVSVVLSTDGMRGFRGAMCRR
jgi:hypothetical protein